jgi:ADP-ribose pyrophosphatase YjhB (NUDIX family)
MLTKWMKVNEPSTMPLYASHYVGVGGLVLNKDKTKILCIQERRSQFGKLWKIPGGAVDPGESINDAVKREVWEETGLQTRFKGIVAFRELKKYKFGQPDLYFICLMEPLQSEKLDIQFKNEISKAEWKSIDEVKHFGFTRTTKKLCEMVKKGQDPEIMSTELFKLRGTDNTFYGVNAKL